MSERMKTTITGVVIGGLISAVVTYTVPYLKPNKPPTMNLNASPIQGTVPLLVTIHAGSGDPDNDQLTHTWKIDRTKLAKNVESFTHRFEEAGIYNLVLSVSDGNVTRTQSVEITAMNEENPEDPEETARFRVTLVKLKVHSDGDGFEGKGDFVWTFVINGHEVSSQTDETKLGNGEEYIIGEPGVDLLLSRRTPINITGNVIDKDGGLTGRDDRISYSILVDPFSAANRDTLRKRPAPGSDPDVELFYKIVRL